MKYKNYIFDLYGTLVDIHTDENIPALWEKISMYYGYRGAAYTPAELKEAFYGIVSGREADAHEAYPEIDILPVFKELFEQKGAMVSDEEAASLGRMFRALSTEYVKLYPGAKQTLEALRAAGAKVYLLSNAQALFTEPELVKLGIADCFDDIFISSDCGVKKPDVAFFRCLLDKHAINPDESVMIGNDPAADIAGAKAVGLHTVFIRSNISPKRCGDGGAEIVLRKMDQAKLREILLG